MRPLFENGVDPKYKLSDEVTELLKGAQFMGDEELYYQQLSQFGEEHSLAWSLSCSTGELGGRSEGYPLKGAKIFVNGQTDQFHERVKELTAIEEAVRITELRRKVFGPFMSGNFIDPTHSVRSAREVALESARDRALELDERDVVHNYVNTNLAIAKRYQVLSEREGIHPSLSRHYADLAKRESAMMRKVYNSILRNWQSMS